MGIYNGGTELDVKIRGKGLGKGYMKGKRIDQEIVAKLTLFRWWKIEMFSEKKRLRKV